MEAGKITNKKGRPKGSKKEFRITYEIVPPGSIKRDSPIPQKTPDERWEEIVEICSAIIAEACLKNDFN